MSIQIITILDFGETLTICDLDTMLTLSDMCVALMNISITLELIGTLVSSMIYRMSRIFKYDFD